jgi:hypothetical protein
VGGIAANQNGPLLKLITDDLWDPQNAKWLYVSLVFGSAISFLAGGVAADLLKRPSMLLVIGGALACLSTLLAATQTYGSVWLICACLGITSLGLSFAGTVLLKIFVCWAPISLFGLFVAAYLFAEEFGKYVGKVITDLLVEAPGSTHVFYGAIGAILVTIFLLWRMRSAIDVVNSGRLDGKSVRATGEIFS